MKIINTLLTLIFILFASFQFNDPDPVIWITLYGYVAAMSAMAVFKKYSLPLLAIGIVVFSVYCIYLSPSIFKWISSGESLMNRMSGDKSYIEESREAFGLLIGLITLVFHLIVRNKYIKAKSF